MKLRLWDVEALAEDLREDRLGEPGKGLYLALSVALGLVTGNRGLFQMATEPAGLLRWTLIAGCYGLGILLVFRRNQAGDGVRFIERYVCLGVPAYVRMLCLLYGTYLGLGIVARDWMATNGVAVFYALAIPSFLAFFWWLWRGMEVAASRTHESVS